MPAEIAWLNDAEWPYLQTIAFCLGSVVFCVRDCRG